MISPDTIAALTTPAAPAARAIVRTSGTQAFELATAISSATADAFADVPAAIAVTLTLADGIAVRATLLAFRGPRSSTGEDVAEYHLPGSPALTRLLLKRLFALGARLAEPGEFTSRAFINGRLDLSAAEGVVATIGASGRDALDAARRLMAGELATRLRPILERVAHTLALVEVDLDFSEEDVRFIAADEVRSNALATAEAIDRLLAAARRVERTDHEPRVVLVGRPNAGKSSLLNALAGGGRAIVSDVAGTTRDALSASVDLGGGRRVTLVDVAGLDESAVADGAIAAQMDAAARREAATADLVVRVRASDDVRPPLDVRFDLDVASKSDLATSARPGATPVSVVTGDGLNRLRTTLADRAFPSRAAESADAVALNERHRLALAEASAALVAAAVAIEQGPELAAAELRVALGALGGVLGTVTPDDVLGRIFAGFCIGK